MEGVNRIRNNWQLVTEKILDLANIYFGYPLKKIIFSKNN